jgi:hypothetical protein
MQECQIWSFPSDAQNLDLSWKRKVNWGGVVFSSWERIIETNRDNKPAVFIQDITSKQGTILNNLDVMKHPMPWGYPKLVWSSWCTRTHNITVFQFSGRVQRTASTWCWHRSCIRYKNLRLDLSDRWRAEIFVVRSQSCFEYICFATFSFAAILSFEATKHRVLWNELRVKLSCIQKTIECRYTETLHFDDKTNPTGDRLEIRHSCRFHKKKLLL